MNDKFINHLKSMMHSPVHNYIIPGLTSWKIGEPSEKGMVRLFTCSRNHHECISPHSHRFDFDCLVVSGHVDNITWVKHKDGDEFMVSRLSYNNEIGNHTRLEEEVCKFKSILSRYGEGKIYGMSYNQIHSIRFTKNSMVLFFEGEDKTNETFMLEPYVNGKKVPTGRVQDWMFIKE